MTEVKFNFDNFKSIAKQHKEMWVATSDRGDVPPTVFVEKDGEVAAIIVAPQIDKYAGLHAAKLARIGFDADALSIIMDAHMASEKASKEGMSEEREEEFRKKYPPGSMQKACDEEGACERGDIVDVLLCHRIDRDGNFKMFLLPYSYHGKGGPEFKWLEDHPSMERMNATAGTVDEAMKYKGFIPEALGEIMAEKRLLDQEQIGSLLRSAGEQLELSPERQQYHLSRAILRVLNSQGFMVFDQRKTPDGDDPDPIMPYKAVSVADLIPAEVTRKISELARERGGEPGFEEELVALLKPYQKTINERAKKCDLPLEVVQAEKIAEGIAHSFKKERKPPFRVRVKSGDQSEDLGEGTYVGDVQVYCIALPDGNIKSLKNAEVRPSDEEATALGGKVMDIGSNPKIVLDKDKEVVYGCQVWWACADEKDDE